MICVGNESTFLLLTYPKYTKLIFMRKLTATLCLTLTILLGSMILSWSAEPIAGFCLSGTKHSHSPITSKCSSAYERGNYQTAFEEFQLLAKRGDANAQFNIGQI